MIKKLLSLAAVATVAISANAYDLSLSELASGWNSTYAPETKTITYESDWSGRGWWLGAEDFSAYTDVIVTTAPTTIQAKLVVEYGADGVKTGTAESALGNLGDTELRVPLDAELKNSVMQIYIQCGTLTDAPTVTLVSAQVIDRSGVAPDMVLWSGEKEVDWWDNAVLVPSLKLKEALKVGYNLAVHYTSVEGADYGSLILQTLNADWTQTKLPCMAHQVEGSTCFYQEEYESLGINQPDGAAIMAIGEASYDLLTGNIQSLMIVGHGVIVTRVEVIDPTYTDLGSIDVAGSSPVYYNLQGVAVSHPTPGSVYIVRRGATVTKQLIR